jgi:ABC-type branched-subunit amino acid transport system substrate-binding protein
MRRLTAAALFALLSCTGQRSAPPEPPVTAAPSPTAEPIPPPSATVRLVADDDPALDAYEDGMRFALREVTARGDLDLELLQAPSVEGALTLDPAAVIVVGDSSSVKEARPAIEEARMPVFLLGGDLYSSQAMFRYAFQTEVPIRWQAGVIARYLVADRGYGRVVLIMEADSHGTAERDSFGLAMAEEGGAIESITMVPPGGPGETFPGRPPVDEGQVMAVSDGADAVIFSGSAQTAAGVSAALARLADPPQLALTAESLDVSFASGKVQPRPGTVTCYTYAWSGWADMLPRVHSFRERFAAVMGHYPASLEQEGYDAVMALGEALTRTGGAGGDRLVQELETFREETYASVPARLGPDDHVLAEQSHLGLFAIEEPVDAALPAGEASSLLPWRPILRTFTTDGEKMNFLDRDKRIFFPFWRPKRPTPKYWRAEYGIVSRSSDPLH